MVKVKKGYVWGIVLLMMVGFFAFRVAEKFFKAKPTISQGGTAVEVQTAKLGSVEDSLILTGNAEVDKEVVISSKRSNRIRNIYAEENQRITQGQVLVQMDVSDLNAQLAQNNAQTQASQATSLQVKAQLDNATTDLKRMQALFAQGAISQQELDSAKAQYSALAAQYRAALAQINATRSGASYVAVLANDTTIRAPFNGVVISKSAEAGEVIDSGKPIITVAKVDKMKVKANVSELDVTKIKIGQEVKVLVDALPGETFIGQVKQILPQVDLASRSLVAEIVINNPQFKVKPDMFARAYITTAQHNNTIVIEKRSIIYRNNKPYVYIVLANKAKLVPVTLGLTQGEQIEIIQGLKAGDKVVTVGQNVIDNNALVDVRKVGE